MLVVMVAVVGGFVLLCGFCVVGLLGIGYMGFYSMGSAGAFFLLTCLHFLPPFLSFFFCAALVLCYSIDHGSKMSVT